MKVKAAEDDDSKRMKCYSEVQVDFQVPGSSTTRLRRAVLLKASCRCRDKRILSQRRNAPPEPFFCDFPASGEGLRLFLHEKKRLLKPLFI